MTIRANRLNTRRSSLWQARRPAIVVNEGVLLTRIYRLDCGPSSMTSASRRLGMAAGPRAPTIETYIFAGDGVVPNNPRLPLILYRGALETGGDGAASCVALFDGNGWTGAWKNGVYAHHHYHSSAHEVLGVAAGWVRVKLGGEGGQTVELRAGDVVVIPAGVAHKNEGASPDLLVVGAYPGGKSPDMCSPGAQHRERAVRNVREVPLPAADPVYGKPGPLIERWRAVDRG